jgi:hypothetical protein
MSTQFTINLNAHSENIEPIAGFRLLAGKPAYGCDEVWSGVIVAGRRNRSVLQSRAWRLCE